MAEVVVTLGKLTTTVDLLHQEQRVAALEGRTGMAEVKASVAKLRLAMSERLVGLERRLDTIIDALADLRRDHERHWHPETGTE